MMILIMIMMILINLVMIIVMIICMIIIIIIIIGWPPVYWGALVQGKIFHTGNRGSGIPLENVTDNPLEISSGNPLGK